MPHPSENRDRDESGRPRSSRPRDALGRPLPHGSRGVARIPDEIDLSPEDLLRYAEELLDRGLAFNAHEVLEAAWKDADSTDTVGDQRPMWQGLAQFAVGITHVQRGNVNGAIVVLQRAVARLAVIEQAPYGVDVAGVVEHAEALVRDLGAGVEISAGRLSPALTIRAPG